MVLNFIINELMDGFLHVIDNLWQSAGHTSEQGLHVYNPIDLKLISLNNDLLFVNYLLTAN